MIRLVLLLVAMTLPSHAETLRMAVTTSFHNSGLADVLLPEIETDTGISVQLLVVGTGQALRLGEAGDVDALLVHSKAAEEAFVAAGHAPYRRQLMYNDFVLVGPADDPAQISGAATAAQALTAIGAAQSSFVSRGDDSGTHKKELSLWPNQFEFGAWYKEAGAGMGATLNTASGLNAYTLADRASWLKFGNKADLALLFSGDPELFNQYAFLPVSASKGDHIKADLAKELKDWLMSDRAAELIDGYRLEGEQLFTFNAR